MQPSTRLLEHRFFEGKGCDLFFMRDAAFSKNSPHAWRQCRNGARKSCAGSSYWLQGQKYCQPVSGVISKIQWIGNISLADQK